MTLTLKGETAANGDTRLFVKRANLEPPSLRQIVSLALPQKGIVEEIKGWRIANFTNIWRGLKGVALSRILGLSHLEGRLYLEHIRSIGNASLIDRLLIEYAEQYQSGISFPYWAKDKGISFERAFLGLASLRVVTTAGVGFFVDAFQNSVELEIMRYHGLGTGTNAEAVGDTALQTELTTQYNPDSTRATGSLTEGASANIYRTVGTNTFDASAAITEHGILSQAATGGGVLLDRSVFSVVNVASGDSIQSTYDHTQTAGS